MLSLEWSTCKLCSPFSFAFQATGTWVFSYISLAPTIAKLVDAVFLQKVDQDVSSIYSTSGLILHSSSFLVSVSFLMAFPTSGINFNCWCGVFSLGGQFNNFLRSLGSFTTFPGQRLDNSSLQGGLWCFA